MLIELLIGVGRIIFKSIKRFIIGIHRKKRYLIPFYLFVIYLFTVIWIVKTSGDSNYQTKIKKNVINDITQLNPVYVSKVIEPRTINDISSAILMSTGPISIGGGKFSMGGQTAYENSLHIDMRKFNKVLNLDKEKKQVIVQAGITWRDLQKVIDKENLSIKIMQTYANFTVGGSVSVNCHGRYIGHGPIISSVLELEIVTADGNIIKANRNENYDVFKGGIGGYGAMGVITKVTLQLEDNVKVIRKTEKINIENYVAFFNSNIRNNSKVIFQNGDLYPPKYNIINNVSWLETDKALTDTVRVTQQGENYGLEHTMVSLVSKSDVGKWARKAVIDPLVYSSEKVVWRNREASYDVAELEPKSREKETYVLQEYFIPVNKIQEFIPKMKNIYEKHDVNIINVSLRHALPDHESYLSWAEEEVMAFVIYYKQNTEQASKNKVEEWTVEMTDAILSVNGKWYLPYQPHATVNQFRKAFNYSKKFFDLKNKLDPKHRFTNKLLDKYNPYITAKIEAKRKELKGYYRGEEQTFLTIPEWYLVFNPKEYADYLEGGKNPSKFPFYASVVEYWKLYDRSVKLVKDVYPENKEYKTMLQVIGVSVTMEYVFKLFYENTLGIFFGWFANDELSAEESEINKAQRAYSDFIYHTAWYEFEFVPWISKVWKIKDVSNASVVRKIERSIFFSMEFLFKAFYAKIIEYAAKNSFEEPVTDIYALIKTHKPIDETKDLKVISVQENKQLIAITRWGAFTKTINNLAKKPIEILEIGGNQKIVVSVLKPIKGKVLYSQGIQFLYNSKVVTASDKIERELYSVSVKELLSFVNYLNQNNFELEHVFDY